MDDEDYQQVQEDFWSDGVDATDDMIQEQVEEDRRNSY